MRKILVFLNFQKVLAVLIFLATAAHADTGTLSISTGISRIPNPQDLKLEYQTKLQALKTCKVNGFKKLEKIIKESLGI